MSFSISLKIDRPVEWPHLCACCGGTALQYPRATASYQRSTGAFPAGPVWVIKGKSTSISYPVCNKHWRLCNLLDLPAEWGFVGSFVMVIIIPWIIMLIAIIPMIFLKGILADIVFYIFLALAILSFISLVALFIFSPIYKPLAIDDIKDDYFILKLTNESFYKELKRINEKPDVIYL